MAARHRSQKTFFLLLCTSLIIYVDIIAFPPPFICTYVFINMYVSYDICGYNHVSLSHTHTYTSLWNLYAFFPAQQRDCGAVAARSGRRTQLLWRIYWVHGVAYCRSWNVIYSNVWYIRVYNTDPNRYDDSISCTALHIASCQIWTEVCDIFTYIMPTPIAMTTLLVAPRCIWVVVRNRLKCAIHSYEARSR